MPYISNLETQPKNSTALIKFKWHDKGMALTLTNNRKSKIKYKQKNFWTSFWVYSNWQFLSKHKSQYIKLTTKTMLYCVASWYCMVYRSNVTVLFTVLCSLKKASWNKTWRHFKLTREFVFFQSTMPPLLTIANKSIIPGSITNGFKSSKLLTN